MYQFQPPSEELLSKVSYIRSLFGFHIDNFKHVSEEDILEMKKVRPTTRMLSVHVINGCNLSCRGCNHNSTLLSGKSKVDIDQVIDSLKKFLPKVTIWSHISIIGGEPLLEPRTKEVVKVTRELCEQTNQPCNVKLFTNGSRILEEKEWIADEMEKGVILRYTFHQRHATPEGKRNYERFYEFVKYLETRNFDFKKTLEVSEAFRNPDDSFNYWFDILRYEIDGTDIKYYPWEDNDIKSSFEHCTCPNSQLYDGKLWKCPMISYMRESLAASNQSDDPEWKKYLKYEPTSIDASLEDITKSFDEVEVPHWICNMCPAKLRKRFVASNQLEGKKKTVDMIHDSDSI